MKFFVYGTLKKGMKNSHIMEKVQAEFISECSTIEKYPMFDLGDGFPYVQDKHGSGMKIYGELYNVDKKYESSLDYFEGVPILYKKGIIGVEYEGVKYSDINCYFIANELKDEELTDVELFDNWME